VDGRTAIQADAARGEVLLAVAAARLAGAERKFTVSRPSVAPLPNQLHGTPEQSSVKLAFSSRFGCGVGDGVGVGVGVPPGVGVGDAAHWAAVTPIRSPCARCAATACGATEMYTAGLDALWVRWQMPTFAPLATTGTATEMSSAARANVMAANIAPYRDRPGPMASPSSLARRSTNCARSAHVDATLQAAGARSNVEPIKASLSFTAVTCHGDSGRPASRVFVVRRRT
jgi:hypothetical protein